MAKGESGARENGVRGERVGREEREWGKSGEREWARG